FQVKIEELKRDYKLNESDNTYIKHYEINNKKAKGVSCFVPLETLHNVSSERLNNLEIPYYFLPEGLDLLKGLALIYTHCIKLRFPSGDQGGLHFVIAPTMHIKKEQYIQTVKELDWQLCMIKASVEMDELISHDDDLEGVEDFRMNELYWLMEIWHTQTTNAMDHLHANDIHTWILLDKPSFQDLL
ncbi:18062_t:CDS:2, partial [Dentiscutata erythropus]